MALESPIRPDTTPSSQLITRRSQVRILPPLYGSRLSPGGFRAYGSADQAAGTPPGSDRCYLIDRAALTIRSVVILGREIITTCEAPRTRTVLRGWMRSAMASSTSV